MKKAKENNWIKVGKFVDGQIVPPEPLQEEFSIDLSPEDEELLFNLAEQRKQTFNQFIEAVLKEYLETFKAKKQND
jgi:predicted HicB family RNase H-like nuclease